MSSQSSGVFWGVLISHGMFVLSGATYSFYWVLQEMAPGPTAMWMFFISLIFGFSGAIGTFAGCIIEEPEMSPSSGFKLSHIVGACAALLVIMYLLTSVAMGRIFTAELVFVTIWAAIELCSLRVAHRRGWIAGRKAAAALAGVVFALAIGLVCYTVYFLFNGRARFLTGLVPYGAVSLAMLLVGVLLLLGEKRSG